MSWNECEVERAKSDRAKCSKCNRKIAGGEKRVAVKYPYYRRIETRYLCIVCGFNNFKKEILNNLEQLKKLGVRKGDFKNFSEDVFNNKIYEYMKARLTDEDYTKFVEETKK